MRKSFFSVGIALFLAVTGSTKLSMAQGVPQLGTASIDEVIAAMTIEEKAHFLNGTGMEGASGNDA